jgi:energy-coupling factor transporter ATP-binding protein EcfA2
VASSSSRIDGRHTSARASARRCRCPPESPAPPSASGVSYPSGSVYIDRTSLRRQLGIVLQQPYLFADTIRRNIAIGDKGLPLHRIVEAAKKAHIDDFVRARALPHALLVGLPASR